MAQVVRLVPRHGGPIFDGRERFDLFPGYRKCRGIYFYAAGLPNGRTKIGIASRPRERIKHHWATHGGLEWCHLFAPLRLAFRDVARIERSACRLAALKSKRLYRTEMFIGLSRADALACVRQAIAELG